MTTNHKHTPSDYLVILLGILGLLLGLKGLLNPASQYHMMGIDPTSLAPDSPIPGLFGSGSLSAIYVGILYVFGVLNRWTRFKAYLIFARMVMCIGFFWLVTVGRAPHAFIPAAIWEGTGAILILGSLWIDTFQKKRVPL